MFAMIELCDICYGLGMTPRGVCSGCDGGFCEVLPEVDPRKFLLGWVAYGVPGYVTCPDDASELLG
jgi:hypothetical protein